METAVRFAAFRLLLLPILALAAGADAPAPYTRFPEFELAQARPLIVVAKVAPGAGLPAFEQCGKPGVICLHSPEWFRARKVMTLYGDEPAKDFAVVTASHYGQERYEGADAPWLLNLFVHGDDIMMPINQFWVLLVRKDGELFLPIQHPNSPMWLPCGVAEIYEPFVPGEFLDKQAIADLQIGQKDYRWSGVDEHPERFNISGKSAFPRWALRMSRLHDFLMANPPAAKEYRCGDPEA